VLYFWVQALGADGKEHTTTDVPPNEVELTNVAPKVLASLHQFRQDTAATGENLARLESRLGRQLKARPEVLSLRDTVNADGAAPSQPTQVSYEDTQREQYVANMRVVRAKFENMQARLAAVADGVADLLKTHPKFAELVAEDQALLPPGSQVHSSRHIIRMMSMSTFEAILGETVCQYGAIVVFRHLGYRYQGRDYLFEMESAYPLERSLPHFSLRVDTPTSVPLTIYEWYAEVDAGYDLDSLIQHVRRWLEMVAAGIERSTAWIERLQRAEAPIAEQIEMEMAAQSARQANYDAVARELHALSGYEYDDHGGTAT